ncbi:MAG TPA: M20/M25/M40 family metallo-hydrolase [Hyphomicrobiaceae bacterium]|nr:M20/M25/M40 family metallo-hydrolase [Hyphomicrobiaceae bacterium]
MIQATTFAADALLAELIDWVRIESPTYDAAAVNRMQTFISPRIAALGFSVERLPGRDGLADSLRCRRPGASDGPGLLLIAHADTVHPVGTLTGKLPVRREGDKCFGPAIYDMKGGTVMALAALRAVIEAKALKLPVTIIINPDEEIGSPSSRQLIEEEAKRHKYVLIPEPAKGAAGEVTTGRHGFQRFFLTTHGRPAHAGWTNRDGRSAVRVMAQLVEELESKSDFDHGPTYAVSVFHGGQWVNCVPMTCTAQALCVARDPVTFAGIGHVMDGLIGSRADVTIEVERGPVRPLWTAQPATMALYARAKRIAAEIGFALPHGQHGGGSDGNFTGALGVATLDGLGVMGGGAHTLEEHILVSSLVPRTTLLARLIAELD